MKMEYRKLFLFTVFILWISSMNAQVTGYSLGDFYNSNLGSRYGVIVGTEAGITGSPYEKKQFVPGDIYTSERHRYPGIPLRFNIYSGQMEYLKESGEIFEVSSPEKIDSILVDGSKYVYVPYLTSSKVQKGYMKVLTEGTPRLLVRMKISFHKAEPPALYKEAVPAGFDREPDEFYLSFPNQDAIPVSGKKEFPEIWSGKQDELEKYLKSDKIKWNRQDDLVRLMNWFYKLQP
jgi:hypothetical protein